MNPIKNWTLDPREIWLTGDRLRRPECVLQDDDGSLIVADLGGLLRIAPDGSQFPIVSRDGAGGPYAAPDAMAADVDLSANGGISLPNGVCFDGDDAFIICNFGTNVVERLGRDGRYERLFDRVDGIPIGKANFPVIDSAGRLWFSVTASVDDWKVRTPGLPSGYICVVQDGVPRIVAESLGGTNELRFSPDEQWLYVAETAADHITRFRVMSDGRLSDRQIYGPEQLGGGPDGFAFDEAGNIWTTLIGVDRLVVITPEGELLPVWQDADMAARAQERAIGLGVLPGDGLAPRMASVTFGGKDMRTVYVGSLQGTALPTFNAPIAGRPVPRHRWRR